MYELFDNLSFVPAYALYSAGMSVFYRGGMGLIDRSRWPYLDHPKYPTPRQSRGVHTVIRLLTITRGWAGLGWAVSATERRPPSTQPPFPGLSVLLKIKTRTLSALTLGKMIIRVFFIRYRFNVYCTGYRVQTPNY